ncbi:hypothetical protein [Streptomyces pacificus]|uniref:Uncharacterized protein n=1 Tax=Streptomyces pacificus TaxID=2705029 RepID=A0A6A0AZC2_9ACTN|nr:hypothetical protein [Streptomyces pacificus]GFH38309.1 hypothetical protein SCWH03_45510 [Streptomyces pacificus]
MDREITRRRVGSEVAQELRGDTGQAAVSCSLSGDKEAPGDAEAKSPAGAGAGAGGESRCVPQRQEGVRCQLKPLVQRDWLSSADGREFGMSATERNRAVIGQSQAHRSDLASRSDGDVGPVSGWLGS